ncbi:hypothetical protein [Spirosoma rhododendri]|uniref:Uncharacterized protein n=1 Tax=Spirosoma rhododendri TaxID=2728024 RepID=A0A7L5DZR2_9BACT|nr:hypothetical protein [Spirosoma rhododendri]QJD80990.1 hypothetical protein HH216_23125 [Spirosoma rhododendri]
MPQTKENTSTDTKSTSSSSKKRSAVEPGDYFIDGKGRMYVLDTNLQPVRYTPPK